ncbi:ABC transporter permease [Pantoea sp. 1.19]|uniref:ABC transporter permease n=1 Tax=Pantoea sp. 1.19 TaxID=1925589 RepID=UPI00094892F3|nr:ABC transporter permease [Pantoea sp. 1.19]
MSESPSFTVSSALTDEINYILQDRYMKILLFIVPAILIVFVSAMFIHGVTAKIPVALVDHDRSALSREIVNNIRASRSLELVAMPENTAQAQRLMKRLDSYAFVEIPRGASGNLFRPDDRPIVIRYNGQFRSTGSAAYSALQTAVNEAVTTLKGRLLTGASSAESGASPLTLQIASVSNAQNSYERFLAPIAIPVLLCVVLSSAVICAIGRFFEQETLYQGWKNRRRSFLATQVFSRTIPYVTVIFLWLLLYNVWQTSVRGWPILGHAWVYMLAILMLCVLTACIAVMFILLARNVLSALSIATVYTSAALTYSDGTLSILNANGWANFWSNFQPFTHYYRIQLEQVNLGSDIATSLHQFAILSLYIVIPCAVIFLLLGKFGQKKPQPVFQEKITLNGFKGSYFSTLRSIKRCQPIFSTAVVSLLIYSVFYPSAYQAQVNLKIPVAVVDYDRSSLSRTLIDNLRTTRAIDVKQVGDALSPALDLLRNRKVSAVITIDSDAKRHLIRGGNAGIDVHLSGGYMAVASDLRTAITEAITATTDVNRPVQKTASNVVALPLYNPTLGYETFVMPLVFIIILQQTLIFSSAMLMALRNSAGLIKNSFSQFVGTFCGLFTVGVCGALFVFGWVYYLKSYPNDGNILLQLYLIVLFAAAVTALGMLAGSFMDHINRPMQLLPATSMVIFYASGASFPTFNMPDWVVAVMAIFPSSTMIDGFTMLNSQGANIHQLAPVILTISLLACALWLLAMLRLVRRTADVAPGQ